MRFLIPHTVRVTNIKHITTKEGNPMTFVTFANKETFEVLTTKLSLADGQVESDVVDGCDYAAEVEYDGKYGSVTFTSIED